MGKITAREIATSMIEEGLRGFHSNMRNLDSRISIDCQIPGIIGAYLKIREVCNPYLSGKQIEEFDRKFRTYLKEGLE
jgi:hypothetical protein